MKKQILTIIFIFALAFGAIAKPAYASNKVAGDSAMLKNEVLGIENSDSRTEKLETFLEKYNSPLAPHAEIFVDSADRYQLDWKLIPAITGVESSFGKKIPAGSYNAYGWGNGNYRFESWEDSIVHVSKILKEKYIDRGLDTPYKIGPVYAPPSRTWAGKVVYFMKKIECFGEKNCFNSLDLTI